MTIPEKIAQFREKIDAALRPLVDRDYWLLDVPNHGNAGDAIFHMAEYSKKECLPDSDPLLRDYVEDVFLFEDQPADNRTPGEIYLKEAAGSGIYIGLVGSQYGNSVDAEGKSPTEREYDVAKSAGALQWVYFFEGEGAIDPRAVAFREKIGHDHTWRTVADVEVLKREVYSTFVALLRARHLLVEEPFDVSPLGHASMENLDLGVLRWFVEKSVAEQRFVAKKGEAPQDTLTRLGLRIDGELTRASILFFGKQPKEACLSSMVKCVFCPGTLYRRPFVQQVYEGNLFEQVDQAMAFVLSHVDRVVGFNDTESAASSQKFELPEKAVREAIVNAVAHRDYRSHASVEVRVFADRVEIWNPGELPAGRTLSWLFEAHQSVPFNELIASGFHSVRYVERAGSGISVILDECRAAGLPKPNFALHDGSFVLTIFRKKSAIGIEKSAIGAQKLAIGGEKLAIDPEKLAIGSEPTGDKAMALFAIFGADRIFGRSDVSSVLHLPYSNAGYLITQLRKGNVIVPVSGSGKGKYRFNPDL